MRRTAVVLAINLLVGTAALAYLLRRFGTPAFSLLVGRRPSALLLLVFAAVVALTLILDAWRWRRMLAEPPRLLRLAAFPAPGQSLPPLLPPPNPARQPPPP